jgi:mannitol PTS system EIIA component
MSTILKKENIFIGCKPAAKEEILEKLGTVLYENGYTTDRYTEALLEKEKVFNTAIGFGLAIPHGVETMKSEILASGLAIMTVPEGTDWGNGNTVKLIVAIAGKGEEHIDILSNIALSCTSEEDVDRLANASVDELYNTFAG